MRKILFLVSVTLLVAGAGWAQSSQSAILPGCDNTSRDSVICKAMMRIQSQIRALVMQREMMQVNYPWVEALARDMASEMDRARQASSSHRHAFEGIGQMARAVADLAARENREALVQANLLQARCIECHSDSVRSVNGITFRRVFGGLWNQVAERCNDYETRKNPYICRSMLGLSAVNSYLVGFSLIQGEWPYGALKLAGQEIVRISQDLLDKKLLPDSQEHGVRAQELIRAGQEIVRLSDLRDRTELSRQILSIRSTCIACHSAQISGNQN